MDPATAGAPDADALFEHAACGLLLTDPDGTILRANATFGDWVGQHADALRGRRLAELMTVGARLFHQTHWTPLMHVQGSIAEVKLELAHRDGRRIPMLFNARRIAHGGRTYDHVSAMVVADRHKYERELLIERRNSEEAREQLRRANEALSRADRHKDQFLAMLAHELRNPLAGLVNSHRLIQLSPALLDRDRLALERAERQTTQLRRLVEDLLDMSRISRGTLALHPALTSLNAAIEQAVESVAPLVEARNQRLDVHLPARDVEIVGDHARLVQVVVNLLNNAAKFTPYGGGIGVALEADDEEARLRVSDNGRGIAPDDLPRVFGLFVQLDGERIASRQSGLGIGLALVQRLVELHGGRVSAHSDGLGKGATFEVALPRGRAPVAARDP